MKKGMIWSLRLLLLASLAGAVFTRKRSRTGFQKPIMKASWPGILLFPQLFPVFRLWPLAFPALETGRQKAPFQRRILNG